MDSVYENDRAFRVLVVGAGVAGLTASHALQKAGIDHVVLERGEIAPAEGASIAIYPHGARILHQLGCLEAAKQACWPMDRFKSRSPDGKVLADSGFFGYVKENHGEDVLLLERRKFLQILYDCLPDRSYVKLGCKAVDIVDDYTGVSIKLADGTNIQGDMVLGCDGVNSLVRELMWNNANKSSPGLVNVKEKTSVTTSWSCLIGMAPGTPEMGERDMTAIHNDRYSFLILTQPDKTFFFVFYRLQEPISWPKWRRYAPEEVEDAAQRVADHPISDTMVFGELWKRRTRGTLISLEEGILERWWFGRTTLAGDAAHKITPNIALGGNSSMESVVVLCNHLHRMTAAHQGARPSRKTLNRVFAAYEAERKPRMKQIKDYSALITRLQAWDTAPLKFVANWIVPYAPDRLIADDLGKSVIRTAPKLDYVDVGEGFGSKGRVSWADEEGKKKEEEEKSRPHHTVAAGKPLSYSHKPRSLAEPTSVKGVAERKGNQSGQSASAVQLTGALAALSCATYFIVS